VGRCAGGNQQWVHEVLRQAGRAVRRGDGGRPTSSGPGRSLAEAVHTPLRAALSDAGVQADARAAGAACTKFALQTCSCVATAPAGLHAGPSPAPALTTWPVSGSSASEVRIELRHVELTRTATPGASPMTDRAKSCTSGKRAGAGTVARGGKRKAGDIEMLAAPAFALLVRHDDPEARIRLRRQAGTWTPRPGAGGPVAEYARRFRGPVELRTRTRRQVP